jgi:hypothetical protein
MSNAIMIRHFISKGRLGMVLWKLSDQGRYIYGQLNWPMVCLHRSGSAFTRSRQPRLILPESRESTFEGNIAIDP